jgi:hypothetical protein
MTTEILTQTRLKELLHYDQETGLFTRLASHKNGLAAGTLAGTKQNNRKPYLVIRIDRRLYLCHRLAVLYITGAFPAELVDHINGDGFDNRWRNLRLVSNVQNLQASLRTPKHNTSGFKGVAERQGRFIAGISVDGRRKHIGTFNSAAAAHAAYRTR